MPVQRIYEMMFLLFLTGFCCSCGADKKGADVKKVAEVAPAGTVFTTDDPAFNKETGEFNKDENTLLLFHCNEGKEEFIFDSNNYDIYGLLENGTWLESLFKTAVKLSGGNDAIIVENGDYLNPRYAITVEMWLFIEDNQLDGYPTVMVNPSQIEQGSGTPNFSYWIVNLHHDQFPVYSFNWRINVESGEFDVSSSTAWKELAGVWHYVAGTYDGKAMKLYIDGELNNFRELSGLLVSKKQDSPFYIGRNFWSPGSNDFKGSLDELRISKVARSEKAIKAYWEGAKHFREELDQRLELNKSAEQTTEAKPEGTIPKKTFAN